MDDFRDISELKKDIEKISELSQKERHALAVKLRRESESAGRVLVDRAIRDKLFSKVEWLYFQELGLGLVEMYSLLSAYYDSRQESHEKDKFGILTSVNSPIWANRDFILERFKLKVMTFNDLENLSKSGALR